MRCGALMSFTAVKHRLIKADNILSLIAMQKSRKIRRGLEVWKELLPSIGVADLYRLISRIKRHAKVISCSPEHGNIALVLGYNSLRDRISTRVLLSSWVGKRSYRSIQLSGYSGRRVPAKIA